MQVANYPRECSSLVTLLFLLLRKAFANLHAGALVAGEGEVTRSTLVSASELTIRIFLVVIAFKCRGRVYSDSYMSHLDQARLQRSPIVYLRPIFHSLLQMRGDRDPSDILNGRSHEK